MVDTEPKQHYDILGNPLDIGTTVAVNDHQMCICTVTKINPKMLRVTPVNPKYRGKGLLKYPSDMVTVAPELVTLYVLRQT
mgnify:CR=1 FL=1